MAGWRHDSCNQDKHINRVASYDQYVCIMHQRTLILIAQVFSQVSREDTGTGSGVYMKQASEDTDLCWTASKVSGSYKVLLISCDLELLEQEWQVWWWPRSGGVVGGPLYCVVWSDFPLLFSVQVYGPGPNGPNSVWYKASGFSIMEGQDLCLTSDMGLGECTFMYDDNALAPFRKF
jgi:hypothetical protein